MKILLLSADNFQCTKVEWRIIEMEDRITNDFETKCFSTLLEIISIKVLNTAEIPPSIRKIQTFLKNMPDKIQNTIPFQTVWCIYHFSKHVEFRIPQNEKCSHNLILNKILRYRVKMESIIKTSEFYRIFFPFLYFSTSWNIWFRHNIFLFLKEKRAWNSIWVAPQILEKNILKYWISIALFSLFFECSIFN